MRGKALVNQAPAVGDAKAVLLINHDEAQLLKHDTLLKQGMGATNGINFTVCEAFKHHPFVTGLVLAGKDFKAQANLGH